ncbi:MAG: hypothetical protein ACLFPE_03800 [Bacteroidales bacterium]
MMKLKFIYWKDGNEYLGYLEKYPDYITQGTTLDELTENLKDIYKDLDSGEIPAVRKSGELEIA